MQANQTSAFLPFNFLEMLMRTAMGRLLRHHQLQMVVRRLLQPLHPLQVHLLVLRLVNAIFLALILRAVKVVTFAAMAYAYKPLAQMETRFPMFVTTVQQLQTQVKTIPTRIA